MIRRNCLGTFNIGKIKKVIIESINPDIERGNIAFGMTDNFIQVKTYGYYGKKGDLIKVKLRDIDNESMIGKVLQSKI